MEKEEKKEFTKKLKELLKEYNVQIGFACDECSDTYGIYDARIEVRENRSDTLVCGGEGWWVEADDIK